MLRSVCCLAVLSVAFQAGAVAPQPAYRACEDAAASAELAGSECAWSAVPLRHAQPAGDTIELFVRRLPTPEATRRGEVWLIAGGPGESGASLYPTIPTFRRAFSGYDLIIPDHRGTGRSARLCPEQEAAGSADGTALAGSEWGPCIGALYAAPSRTHAFSVTEAAHDLALLMQRHGGQGSTMLYGVSYGTQLALRMLQVAPVPLDGLVLDGLVPPETSAQWDLSHRTDLVDEVGRALLDAPHLATYRRLLGNAATAPWNAQVPGGDLRRFFATLLNFPALRERIPGIIDGLARDDASKLTSAAAALGTTLAAMEQGGNNQPSLPLVMLISASENNARPGLTQETVAAEAKDALFVSPLPGFLVATSLPTYARDAWFGKSPKVIPRTLVIHGTLDPNTSYAGALAHAKLLGASGDVTFSTVERGAHMLSYMSPSCFATTVGAFAAQAPVAAHCTEPGQEAVQR